MQVRTAQSHHRQPLQRDSASLTHTDFHRFARNDEGQDLEAEQLDPIQSYRI